MLLPDSMTIIEGLPGLSMIIWFVILSSALYIMRNGAHQVIYTFSRMLYRTFRITSHSIIEIKNRVQIRNKEVLIANAKEANEHIIAREFDRIDDSVKKDLASYPALQHKIAETITIIDEDYQKSAEIPPEAPGWAEAITPIANIKSNGDSMVANVLISIRSVLEKGQEKALVQYRQSSKKRHEILKNIAPKWRIVQKDLSAVDLRMKSILERSKSIDRHMENFENIVKEQDKALASISSSSLTQFFIAGFVLAIAVGGAMINFNLIARPMQEMVGGASYMMNYKISDIAALVIILVEISMGLFLMESMRITHLFPMIGALNDKIRFRMVIVSFVFLLLLASIEMGLAYMRELLSQDDAALMSTLSNAVSVRVENSGAWITTASQMGMGFVLPFALTFIAIPLESFIHSFRTVLGVVVIALLYFLAFLARFIGAISLGMGKMLISIYDLIIFLPLWIEDSVRGKRNSQVISVSVKNDKSIPKEKK